MLEQLKVESWHGWLGALATKYLSYYCICLHCSPSPLSTTRQSSSALYCLALLCLFAPRNQLGDC